MKDHRDNGPQIQPRRGVAVCSENFSLHSITFVNSFKVPVQNTAMTVIKTHLKWCVQCSFHRKKKWLDAERPFSGSLKTTVSLGSR